jgi:hypothetical protein
VVREGLLHRCSGGASRCKGTELSILSAVLSGQSLAQQESGEGPESRVWGGPEWTLTQKEVSSCWEAVVSQSAGDKLHA